eukprot:3744330-Alexandrium_andersonii.AAC.1
MPPPPLAEGKGPPIICRSPWPSLGASIELRNGLGALTQRCWGEGQLRLSSVLGGPLEPLSLKGLVDLDDRVGLSCVVEQE